jgi:para-nitrobenzyl esterase
MIAFRSAPLLIAAFWTAIIFAQPVAPVTLSSGPITGTDLGTVQSWLGIPYAAPPVGALRWKPPQPPPSWEGVRAMDHYGAVCMQSRPAAGTTTSEDCLTLNVWAPKSVQEAAVMLWIHGGAFIEGSGALPIYAGTEMARQGVIVVTINYRLGGFGFFAHPVLSKESVGEPATNFGFQDQIAALRWVRQNIAAFGGDPQNVTIFGESAGGSSVNYLMLSPPARGLFQKAIAESGGGQSRTQTLAELEAEGAQRVQSWGAADLAAMRALPAETILKTPRRLTLGGIGPVVDGKFVLADPAYGFQQGKQAPVPFLLGANSYEASLMSMFGITADGMMAGMLGNGEKLRQFYGADPQKAAPALFTDFVFLAPARYLAAQMEKVKQPAYLYFFSYRMERLRAQAPGAPHGGEVPFVFGHFPGALNALATAEDRKMAATVVAAWAQFAKTGNPNRDGSPEWPAYTASTDRIFEWGSPIGVRDHFRAEQLDLLTLVSLMRPKF